MDYNPPPRQRGRPKGSKNKPKDSAQTTIVLGSEIPSQTRVTDQTDQGLSSQGSNKMAPSQDSQDQTSLDLNCRIT